MCKSKPKVWLKKYMKLNHLKSTLNKRELYLGNQKNWHDKNDRELIGMYSASKDATQTLVTCLTYAVDRFHFWKIFGKGKNGVCLWFKRDEFDEDIKKDKQLIGNDVKYLTVSELYNLSNLEMLPFCKRRQYQSEYEYRVIKSFYSAHPNQCGAGFSPSSLARIYLNPWLPITDANRWKSDLAPLLVGDYSHVKVLQNRSLRYEKWIDAAKNIPDRKHS